MMADNQTFPKSRNNKSPGKNALAWNPREGVIRQAFLSMYLTFPDLRQDGQNSTDKCLPDSHLFREKFIRDNPTTRSRVDRL